MAYICNMNRITLVSNKENYDEIISTLDSHGYFDSARTLVIGETYYIYIDKESTSYRVDNFKKKFGTTIQTDEFGLWRTKLMKFMYNTEWKLKKWTGYIPPKMHEKLLAIKERLGQGDSSMVKLGLSMLIEKESNK